MAGIWDPNRLNTPYTQDASESVGSPRTGKFEGFVSNVGNLSDTILGFLGGVRDTISGTKVKTEVGVNKGTMTAVYGLVGLVAVFLVFRGRGRTRKRRRY